MSKPHELQTIDTAALAQVSGGVVAPVPPTTADPVLTALTGILDSLKTLSQQNTGGGGGFNQQEMLMFMLVMQRNQQAAAAAAAASAGGWWNQQPIVHYY